MKTKTPRHPVVTSFSTVDTSSFGEIFILLSAWQTNVIMTNPVNQKSNLINCYKRHKGDLTYQIS